VEAGEPFMKDLQLHFHFKELTAQEFEKRGAVFDALWKVDQRHYGRHDVSSSVRSAEERY
jgi:hypothetical protein